MLYKFKSPASGDVIMLAESGDQFLRLLGREPAAQGIIETAAMPAALAALEAAIKAAPASPAEADDSAATAPASDPTRDPVVALRQRLWPMVDMLRRAHAAGKTVVWGV